MDHDIPPSLRLTHEAAPTPELRASLGQAINSAMGRTVPVDTRRFALLIHDDAGTRAAGLSGMLSWQWLFVEALWVGDAWRRQGLGRTLLARAEAHARAEGCHAAWLDTFQARDFYISQGWQSFGTLDDYPPGQTRHFLRKSLTGPGAG
jgi:GNAT superfamily N-acetyltransferase